MKNIGARQRKTDLQHRDLEELAARIERWRRQLAAYGQAHRQDEAISQAIEAKLVAIGR